MSHVLSILPLFFLSAVSGFFIAFVVALIFQREDWKDSLLSLVALSLMGSCAGLAGGLSREAAVGDIIPVFLGLIGAVAIYLFGSDRSCSVIVSLGLIALTIALMISYALGANNRTYKRHVFDEYLDLRTHCAHAYTNVALLQNEVAFQLFKENKLGAQCEKVLCWRIKPDKPDTPSNGTKGTKEICGVN